MNRKHDTSLPPEIARALQDEPAGAKRRLERVWDVLGAAQEMGSPAVSTDDAWKNLQRAVETETADRPAVGRDVRRSERFKARGAVAFAAAAVVVGILGLLWIRTPVTVRTSAGEQRTIQLPDGSIVELNSASSIERPRLFGSSPLAENDRRWVRLDGEAYFRVVPSGNPFAVITPEATVEVLGTEFNVRSRSTVAEEGTVVTLASGRVRVESRQVADSLAVNARPTIVLSLEGESARITRAGGIFRTDPTEATTLDYVLAWRRSGFAIVDRPLQAVLDEMERRYAVEIAPRNGVNLSDPMNVFYLRGAEPEQILRDICLAQDCTYRETSRGYGLSPRTTEAEGSTSGSGLSERSRP